MNLILTAFAGFGLVALAVAAYARDPFDVRHANVALLMDRSVQEELRISEAQRKRMNALADRYNSTMQKVVERLQKAKTPPSEPDPEARKAAEALQAGIVDVLIPAQLKRLREISLQVAGLAAMGDESVAKRIGLSNDQLRRVRTILEDAYGRLRKMESDEMEARTKDLRGRQPKTEQERAALAQELEKRSQEAFRKLSPAVEKLRRETESRLFQILSDKQEEAWKALLGRPFRFGPPPSAGKAGGR